MHDVYCQPKPGKLARERVEALMKKSMEVMKNEMSVLLPRDPRVPSK